MAAYVSLLSLHPRADQSHVIRCAEWLAEGDYAQWDEGGYLYVYPHQNALVLAFYAVVKIFGANSWLAIQFINIPLFVASAFCLADTAKLIFDSRTLGAWAYAALLLFFPLSMYVTFVYGTLVGLALSLAGLWLIVRALKGRSAAFGFLGAALAALSVLLRVNFLVPIIAFAIALFFYALRTRSAKPIAYVAALLVCLVGGRMLVSLTVERMTGRAVNEGNPAVTWIAMGFQDSSRRSAGWYNSYNLDTYVENGYDEARAEAQAVASIRLSLGGFLRDKKAGASFFARKIASQWNNSTFEGIAIAQNRRSEKPASDWVRSLLNESGFLYGALARAGDMLLPAIWLGALLFLALGYREHDVFSLVFVIAFIGGFFFSLIWEAKCQYVVAYVFMLIPCALRGYQLAIVRPARGALALATPIAAIACVAAAVAFVLPAGKSEKAYAALRWRAAGGAVPAGTYVLACGDGHRLLYDGDALSLSEDGGTPFEFGYGSLRADEYGMALEAEPGLDDREGAAVGMAKAMGSLAAQRWYADPAKGGGYYIRFGTGLVLTCEPDGGLALREPTGADHQTWYFTRTED